jgi:tetratricopeptide (TPR) repeat protein
MSMRVVFVYLITLFSLGISFAQRVDIKELKQIVSDATSPQSKVDALNDLFLAFIFINQDSAIKYKDQAFALATNAKYIHGLAYNKGFEGIMYKLAGAYSGASEHFLSALALFEANKDSSGIGFIYNEFAIISMEQGFYALSENYFL